MRAGKRVLAVLLVFLLLIGNGIIQADAGSLYDTETLQTDGESQTEKVQRESRSTVSSEDSGDGTAKSSEEETSVTEQSTESRKSRSEQTTEAQTEQNQESAQTEAAKTARAAASVEITSPNDPELISLIPDENFRKVIYESLKAYGWLKGSSQNPPSSVQEILETYQGPIRGAKGYNTPDEEKIRSVEGIQYLKIAGTANRNYEIDLTGNLITDLTPVVSACTTEYYHYGGYVYCDDRGGYGYRPVVMSFLDNPLRCIPKNVSDRKVGLLVFTDMTRGDIQYVDEEDLQYYFLREDTERFEGFLRIGFVQYDEIGPDAEYVKITSLSLMGQAQINRKLIQGTQSVSTDIAIEQTDEGPNKNRDVDAKYTNVTKSCSPTIGVGMDECLVSQSTNVSGVYIPNITSMAFTMLPVFTIFDKVEISGEYTGSAQLQKVDAQTGTALNGAVYSLYRVNDNGENDVLIKEGLTTATRKVNVWNESTQSYEEKEVPGYTQAVTGLEPGTYYFKETKPPVGYQVNDEKVMLTVEEKKPGVTGGLKNLDFTSADKSVVKASAKDNETYITWKMEEPVDFYLGSEAQAADSRTEDAVVKSVEITYRSLEGSSESIVETYQSLDAAETALNAYIKNNNITGAVKVKVIYDETADAFLKTVKATDQPIYTKVTVKKDWIGAGGDEVLPEVTYKLYRSAGEDGEKKEINSYTVPEGTGQDAYDYTFETDKDGNQLLMYYADEEGNAAPYIYTVEEEFTSDKYVGGKPGEPETVILYDTLSSGEKIETGSLITIPISNLKMASIKIIKIDAIQTDKKLSDVEFKLEMQDDEGQWKEVAIGITDQRGEVLFKDLGSGEYRLTETKTQEGYILLKEPLLISIGDLTEPDTDREFVYTIKNGKMYGLPAAGGFGSYWFVWAGIILLSLSGIIWIQKKKLVKK